MKRIAPGLDVKNTAEEIRSRIYDELDYELEAPEPALARADLQEPPVHRRARRGHRALAREGHGHRVRPRRRLRHGQGEPTRPRATASARSSSASTSAACTAIASSRGDPHPGNFLLMDDGRVAFLDFGLFKVMPRRLIELELETQRAGHEGDAQRLWEIWAEGGLLKQPDKFRPDKLLSQFLDATWWYLTDEEIALQPGDRHAGDDRHVRPALGALRPDASRDAAGRPHLRPSRGDADARRARPAARERNWHRIARSGSTTTTP